MSNNVIEMARSVGRALAEKDREIDKLIGERDAAEEAISQAYYIVIGRSPEWSNKFGYSEALEEIGDALILLKASISAGREII